jgi:hypothetical protein
MNYGEFSVILYLFKLLRRLRSNHKLDLVITSLSTVLYDLICIQIGIENYHQQANIG